MKYLLIFFLTGCASDWVRVSDPASSQQWEHVDRQTMHDICQNHQRGLVACALVIRSTGKCWIYSVLSEQEARNSFMRYGVNVFEHEMRHCNGEKHV